MLQAVSAVQSGGSPSSDVQEALAAISSPVLRIIIDNMFYPVTLDVLQQVSNSFLFLFLFCFFVFFVTSRSKSLFGWLVKEYYYL